MMEMVANFRHFRQKYAQERLYKANSELCYTGIMSPEEQIWRTWVRGFNHWGLNEFIASFLEATAPLATLGAQLVYVCQPAMRLIVPEKHITALTELFDSENGIETFVSILRETN
jgi:hypothetical protein